MRHHGVNIAAVDQKCQPGLAEPLIVGIPLGLRHNADLKALRLQHPGDDRCAEAGVIHIGIPGHDDEIRLRPAIFLHFFYGQR